MSTRLLAVFAKWPAAGAVKTRLGRPPETSAAVARAFLLDTLARLASIDARRVVAFTPSEREADFRALISEEYTLVPQANGDLGQRLEALLHAQFAAGAGRVVILGTDSPTLPVAFVESAFDALAEADVVLGPATDGGYYLLGCRRPPPLFTGIDWSSDRVLAQTVARLPEGWRLALLPPWYDVDTPASWAMLAGHVAAMRRAGLGPGVPHTERWLEAQAR